jgi:hypothetical protein
MGNDAALDRALGALQEHGWLMLSDGTLPSVTTLVAGTPIRGSWWGHPQGPEIYRVSGALGTHPDAVLARLVSGKVTFVHKKLWPALVAMAVCGEPWQTDALSGSARRLLDVVTGEGRLRTDELPEDLEKAGESARELERRLLLRSDEVHTEAGTHQKWLETWAAWAVRVKMKGRRMAAEDARRELEEAVEAVNRKFKARAKLPWNAPAVKARAKAAEWEWAEYTDV